MKKMVFFAVVLFTMTAITEAQQTVKMGIIPIQDALPLYAAIAQGFLDQEGIKVEPEVVAGGAAAIPAIIGGSLQLALSGYTSVFAAREAGFDIVILFPFARNVPGNDLSALVMRADANIQSAKDLEGKTIGINTLRGTAWLYIVEYMAMKGADTKKANFVELPFPAMIGTLRAGRVDLVSAVDPFITLEKEKGGIKIFTNYFTVVNPQMEVAGTVASQRWASQNQELLEKLARAFKKGIDYLNARPEEWPRFLGLYTRMEPALIAKIAKPIFGYPISVDRLQFESDLAYKWGLIRKKQDVKEFVWPTARR